MLPDPVQGSVGLQFLQNTCVPENGASRIPPVVMSVNDTSDNCATCRAVKTLLVVAMFGGVHVPPVQPVDETSQYVSQQLLPATDPPVQTPATTGYFVCPPVTRLWLVCTAFR
jgi:hypothetical protein